MYKTILLQTAAVLAGAGVALADGAAPWYGIIEAEDMNGWTVARGQPVELP